MNNTKSRERLTHEEEKDLIRRMRAGDDSARETLINANTGLVINEALRAVRKYGIRSSSISFEDVVNEGYIGLVRGLEKFDPDMGNKISTYVIWWIRQAIRKFLITNMPGGTISLRTREKALSDRNSVLYSIAMTDTIDIDDDENPIDVPDDRTEENTTEVEREEIRLTIKKALHELAEKKKGTIFEDEDFCYRILNLRFGLETGIPMTLAEVGRRLGISHEYVRTCEDRILKTLKRKKTVRKLSDYVKGDAQ